MEKLNKKKEILKLLLPIAAAVAVITGILLLLRSCSRKNSETADISVSETHADRSEQDETEITDLSESPAEGSKKPDTEGDQKEGKTDQEKEKGTEKQANSTESEKSESVSDKKETSDESTADSKSTEKEPETTTVSENTKASETTTAAPETTKAPETATAVLETTKAAETTTAAPETTAHEHTWVAVIETVHHEAVSHPAETEEIWIVDKEAWDETKEVYGTVTHDVCKGCEAKGILTFRDLMSYEDDWAHGQQHMDNGEESGTYTKQFQEVIGTETIHHDEEGHWETKIVKEASTEAAYDEEVITGYKCSGCGATK